MSIKFEYRNKNVQGSIEFGVMSIPRRKSKALFLSYGRRIDILAYFKSDEAAERFNIALEKVIEVSNVVEAYNARRNKL